MSGETFDFTRILDARSDADSPITEDLVQDWLANINHAMALVRSKGTALMVGAIDSNPSNAASSWVADAGPTAGAIGNVNVGHYLEVTSGTAKGVIAKVIAKGTNSAQVNSNLFSQGMRSADTYRIIYGTSSDLAHTHDGVDSTLSGKTITRFYTAGATWTKPAGLVRVRAWIQAGGGGGGDGNTGYGGGGGGGGGAIKVVAVASLGATETVTVGAGGAAGTGGGAGATGGTSSFGAHASATGGAGGSGSSGGAGTSLSGGAGGVGSGGDLNMKGNGGGYGINMAVNGLHVGHGGGGALFGGGGRGAVGGATGTSGAYGGGGSGNEAGSGGCIMVEEMY